MSLHPRNIEPLKRTMYLTCSLAWLSKGGCLPNVGLRLHLSAVQKIPFSCYRIPPLHCPLPCTLFCKCIFLSLWIVL